MKKEIFKRLIVDNQERTFAEIVLRDIQIPIDTRKIVTLKGVRRCGKTSILYQTIKKLRETVDKTNLVYINFEDDRIFPVQLPDCNELLEAYYEMFPTKKPEKVYFFFDEIQIVENWEIFIRRLHDTENCQIYLCGSSSKLLSSEIASSLRGRSISYEIFPLSFKEFLRFKNIDNNYYSSANYALIRNVLNTYLFQGGFPELIYENEDKHKLILQEYVDLIIYKDLIERYGITNRNLVKLLVKYCYVNISTPLSQNKLFKELKSQGISLSKNTLYEYIDYLREVYAIFTIPLYSSSVGEQNRNPLKLYAIDTGFKAIFSISQDIGRVIENVVMLHLRRSNMALYYWAGKQETDFAYEAEDGIRLVNVCYDLSNAETKTRELNCLLEAMQQHKTNNATLITMEMEELVSIDNKRINIIPLWKWLIDQ
jgi:predicted AAA+ superfamily ATPase